MTGTSSEARAPRVSASRHVRQSAIPLFGALAAVVVSVSLVILSLVAHKNEAITDWLVLPIIPPSFWYVPVIGYILTPMFVIVMVGWDRVSMQRGLQNKYFVAEPRISTWLLWILWASMVVALWHIVNLAYTIDAAISDVGAR